MIKQVIKFIFSFIMISIVIGCVSKSAYVDKQTVEAHSDLEKIGVEKVGVRKKMLTAISEIHKRNWEKTSLPVIKTIDKQKGIYYTCPDAVLMIANVSDHSKYIRANVEHLRKNILDCPDLLSIGQEVANLSDLNKRVTASKASIIATSKEISRLQSVLEVTLIMTDFKKKPNL